MLHNEAIKLILEAYDKEISENNWQIAFSVNTSSIYRLLKRSKETVSYEMQTNHRECKPKITQAEV